MPRVEPVQVNIPQGQAPLSPAVNVRLGGDVGQQRFIRQAGRAVAAFGAGRQQRAESEGQVIVEEGLAFIDIGMYEERPAATDQVVVTDNPVIANMNFRKADKVKLPAELVLREDPIQHTREGFKALRQRIQREILPKDRRVGIQALTHLRRQERGMIELAQARMAQRDTEAALELANTSRRTRDYNRRLTAVEAGAIDNQGLVSLETLLGNIEEEDMIIEQAGFSPEEELARKRNIRVEALTELVGSRVVENRENQRSTDNVDLKRELDGRILKLDYATLGPVEGEVEVELFGSESPFSLLTAEDVAEVSKGVMERATAHKAMLDKEDAAVKAASHQEFAAWERDLPGRILALSQLDQDSTAYREARDKLDEDTVALAGTAMTGIQARDYLKTYDDRINKRRKLTRDLAIYDNRWGTSAKAQQGRLHLMTTGDFDAAEQVARGVLNVSGPMADLYTEAEELSRLLRANPTDAALWQRVSQLPEGPRSWLSETAAPWRAQHEKLREWQPYRDGFRAIEELFRGMDPGTRASAAITWIESEITERLRDKAEEQFDLRYSEQIDNEAARDQIMKEVETLRTWILGEEGELTAESIIRGTLGIEYRDLLGVGGNLEEGDEQAPDRFDRPAVFQEQIANARAFYRTLANSIDPTEKDNATRALRELKLLEDAYSDIYKLKQAARRWSPGDK